MLAWDKGYKGVTLQTDSLLATKWLTTDIEVPVEFSNLVFDCRLLLNGDWETRVDHVWREANNYADVLSKGVSLNLRGRFYTTPTPPFCGNVCFGTLWGLHHRIDIGLPEDLPDFVGCSYLFLVVSCLCNVLFRSVWCFDLWVVLEHSHQYS